MRFYAGSLLRLTCLTQPRGGAEQWEKTRAELLAQVERRLLDLQDGLTRRQC